ncbi:MAG: hypothetical protein M3N93_00895 [Acidobacteriota bacterium]|nr:hypothetical protein [Acidobacteriota bacterium]
MIPLFRWIVRVGGLAALILGLMLSRVAPPALQIHMVLGSLVAASLAMLGAGALIKAVRLPAALTALLWAVAMVYVGVMQARWMGSGNRLPVEVLHVALGIGAIGLAEALSAALLRRRASLPV